MIEEDHVVFFSGGMSSFFTALRVKEKHGNERLKLLFTDTLIEGPDLYRFLKEGAAHLGGELVWLKDGRTPWDVFRDVKFLGNSRIDPCSRILKREPARNWVHENYPDPSSVILYLGMNWDEEHRAERAKKHWLPYRVETPLTEAPHLDRKQMMRALDGMCIFPSTAYEDGFPHDNCGGGCVKMGKAGFRHLLRMRPEVYAEWEKNEEEIRQFLGKDVSILKDRHGGEPKVLTLKELRTRTPKQGELFDWGGCGCFSDFDDSEATP